MRVLETGNYVVVHFGLCEAGKGGVGDCLFFFFLSKKASVFFFLGKKKQEYSPNTLPLNRQIPFPNMLVISGF